MSNIIEGIIFIISSIVCIVGIISESITLGVIFILSLIATIYCITTLFSDKLSKLGKIIFVCNVICLVYTVCNLFFSIDVKAILGI